MNLSVDNLTLPEILWKVDDFEYPGHFTSDLIKEWGVGQIKAPNLMSFIEYMMTILESSANNQHRVTNFGAIINAWLATDAGSDGMVQLNSFGRVHWLQLMLGVSGMIQSRIRFIFEELSNKALASTYEKFEELTLEMQSVNRETSWAFLQTMVDRGLDIPMLKTLVMREVHAGRNPMSFLARIDPFNRLVTKDFMFGLQAKGLDLDLCMEYENLDSGFLNLLGVNSAVSKKVHIKLVALAYLSNQWEYMIPYMGRGLDLDEVVLIGNNGTLKMTLRSICDKARLIMPERYNLELMYKGFVNVQELEAAKREILQSKSQ